MIPEKSLIRWSGLITLLSGALLLVWWGLMGTLAPPTTGEFNMVAMVESDRWVPINILGSLSMILLPIALTGLYLRQLDSMNRLGLVGYLLAFVGSLLYIWLQVEETVLWPLLARHAPELIDFQGPMFTDPTFTFAYLLMGILFVPGCVIFGISMIRAGIVPRWGAILFTIGAPLFGIGGTLIVLRTIGVILMSVGMGSLGWALWKERD